MEMYGISEVAENVGFPARLGFFQVTTCKEKNSDLGFGLETKAPERLSLRALFSGTLESTNKPLINVDDNVLIASNAPH